MKNGKIIKKIITPNIPGGAEKENLDQFTKILQGKGTNAITYTTSRKLKTNRLTDKGIYTTPNKVDVEVTDVSVNILNPIVHRLFIILSDKLTQRLPHKNSQTYEGPLTDEQLENYRTVTLSVDEYAELTDIKHKPTARKQLENSIKTLYNTSVTWEEEVITKGKKNKKTSKHWLLHIISNIEVNKKTKSPIINGVATVKMAKETVQYLSEQGIMYYPLKLLKADLKAYPHILSAGFKLLQYFSLNKIKGNSNTDIISVKRLIESMPSLPTYNEVRATKGQNVTKQIIEPVDRTLIELQKLGIIKHWHYCNAKHIELTDEQITDYSYPEWINWYVKFTLDYPDLEKEIQDYNERKHASRSRKRKKEEPKEQQLVQKQGKISGQFNV